MRYTLSLAGTALLASTVAADLCNIGSQEIAGNYYCQPVDTIQYNNFGASGSYNKVTNMDSTTGQCSSEPFAYSGSLAPLDGEVSMHFRGPMALKAFAFYTPGNSDATAKRSANANERRHAQEHLAKHKHHKHGKHNHKNAERGVGDWVIATMNGKVVSWQNEYTGAAPTPAANAGGAIASTAAQATAAPFVPSYKGDWIQAAVYNSDTQVAKGLTFLNNMGGQGSGVFDYTFGNSLSYASSSGLTGAASSEVLADTTLPSDTEIIIMTDNPCTGTSCGYVREGTVAYHGFGGPSKVFLAEFSMPLDGKTGFNGDMPSYWMLNAQIPRTLQYGNADCSCWSTGCGEFDIMEVLDSGDTRTKSTLHAGSQSAGDSDYIDRPTGAPVKVAVIMSDEKITVQMLNADFDFSKTLTNAQIESIGSHGTGGLAQDLVTGAVSVFDLPA